MRKLVLLCLFTICCGLARGQTIEDVLAAFPPLTKAQRVRYWFDEDPSTLSTCQQMQGKQEMDASGLTEGLHTLHLQIEDESGAVCSPRSEVFIKFDGEAVATPVERICYWFDNSEDVVAIDATTGVQLIDVSALSSGLHTLHFQLEEKDKRVGYMASSVFFKTDTPTEGSSARPTSLAYWFNEEKEGVRYLPISTGVQQIDAAALPDGLHTLHFQVSNSDGTSSSLCSSVFLRMNNDLINTRAQRLRYWFDDAEFVHETDVQNGTELIDVSSLYDGLHTLHYQLVDDMGSVCSPISAAFLKMNLNSSQTAAKTQRYWFDDDLVTMHELPVNNGTQILELDELSFGLHTLHYQLTDENGQLAPPQSAVFVKFPKKPYAEGENTITEYMYWTNDYSQNNVRVSLSQPTSPYQLITLLPMVTAPIRSSRFHFEVTDGQPTIYAKNDIHMRFYDMAGYWADDARSFIDYSVSETLDNVALIEATQTFDRPANNEIKWFRLEAEKGDTIAFCCSQATSLQVFSPSGQEVYATSADKSVKFGGCHTWEDGTYYVAVHDVTGTRPNMTLDYMHMDRYDVVAQDVYTVGNGGASTITYQGNGFNDLYAVELYNAQGDTIKSIDVGHEGDAITTVTFNFTDSNCGSYNALFHFTAENKSFLGNLEVEEADDIELVTNVTYPSTFLNGTSVAYKVEITNKGNMTAYMVPLELTLRVDDINSVEYVKFDGCIESVSSAYLSELDSLDQEDIDEIKAIVDSSSDLSQFIVLRDTVKAQDYGISKLIVTLPPNTTQSFTVFIKSRSVVDFQVLTTNVWFPIAFRESAICQSKNARAISRETMCCEKDKYECYAEIVANIAGVFMPPEAGCATSLSLTGLETAYDVWCSEGNTASERWNNYLKRDGSSLANRLIQSAVTCITGFFGARLKALREEQIMASKLEDLSEVKRISAEIAACRTAEQGVIHDIYDGITTMILGESCYKAHTEVKPNCPPNPDGGGGSSTPVNSFDPNDIYGYTAESGSRFMTDKVQQVSYRIEFENDTTFATASTHVVEIKDTLNARYFNLDSYAPTSIKIGDRIELLDGKPQFVRTIDMRPQIDAIAQVEGFYNKQKGIITYRFTSIDPMTMEPTNDVMQGFLPVNVDGISGIGEVSYNVNLLKAFDDGTQIPNRASIVFDTNEAILTPIWSNTIDAVCPKSRVTEVVLDNDSTATVHMTGSDERSGLWKYEVYVQYGSGDLWEKIGECNADSASLDFRIYDSMDYGFCTLAVDSAGNVEVKEMVREASLDNYLKGDANADGVVDVEDVVNATQYFLGETGIIYFSAADVTGDGQIDIEDVVGISRIYLAQPTTTANAIAKRQRLRELLQP